MRTARYPGARHQDIRGACPLESGIIGMQAGTALFRIVLVLFAATYAVVRDNNAPAVSAAQAVRSAATNVAARDNSALAAFAAQAVKSAATNVAARDNSALAAFAAQAVKSAATCVVRQAQCAVGERVAQFPRAALGPHAMEVVVQQVTLCAALVAENAALQAQHVLHYPLWELNV